MRINIWYNYGVIFRFELSRWQLILGKYLTGTFKEVIVMKTLGHTAWIEAYFRPQPDSSDARIARQRACHCVACDVSRARNGKHRG